MLWNLLRKNVVELGRALLILIPLCFALFGLPSVVAAVISWQMGAWFPILCFVWGILWCLAVMIFIDWRLSLRPDLED